MDEARDQAREHLARLRTSMAPRVDVVTTRLREVPAQLQALRNDLRDRDPPYSHSRNSSLDSITSETSFASSAIEPDHDSPSLLAPPLLRAPQLNDPAYDPVLAQMASKILYRSGRCPVSGGPLLVLCAAAFPDAGEVDYNALLPYVLSNLPGDEELMGEQDGYSVVFFAGGSEKKEGQTVGRPTWKWTLQAYTLVGVFKEIQRMLDEEADGNQLGRAVRKKIQRLWVVHEKSWISEFDSLPGI
jgi:hypothetical protein